MTETIHWLLLTGLDSNGCQVVISKQFENLATSSWPLVAPSGNHFYLKTGKRAPRINTFVIFVALVIFEHCCYSQNRKQTTLQCVYSHVHRHLFLRQWRCKLTCLTAGWKVQLNCQYHKNHMCANWFKWVQASLSDGNLYYKASTTYTSISDASTLLAQGSTYYRTTRLDKRQSSKQHKSTAQGHNEVMAAGADTPTDGLLNATIHKINATNPYQTF